MPGIRPAWRNHRLRQREHGIGTGIVTCCGRPHMSDADEPISRHAQDQADSLELASLPPLGEDQFSDALALLLDRVDSLPAEERRRLKGAADATRQKHEQLRQTVQRLQETL